MPSKKYFLYPFLFIFVVALLCWTFLDHGDLVLFLNARRNPVLDFFFRYWTHLGDGILVGVLFVALLMWKWKISIVFLATSLLQALVSQGLKRLVFKDIPRPTKYFNKDTLDLIEGVKHHGSFSFPSGHTITAFATATFFAILFKKNKYWSLALLISAILVAISRVYLLQHFLRDVLAGAFLGVLVTLVAFKIFDGFLRNERALEQ